MTYVIVFVLALGALYLFAVFSWTGWKLAQWRRVFAPWREANARRDWIASDGFEAESERHAAEYDDFCRRFAPWLK